MNPRKDGQRRTVQQPARDRAGRNMRRHYSQPEYRPHTGQHQHAGWPVRIAGERMKRHGGRGGSRGRRKPGGGRTAADGKRQLPEKSCPGRGHEHEKQDDAFVATREKCGGNQHRQTRRMDRIHRTVLPAAEVRLQSAGEVGFVIAPGVIVLDPEISIDPEAGTVTIVTETRTTDRTGVEMEALVAASVGALTVYDMIKGIEPGVVIERVELLDKTGGKADFHRP